MAAGTRTDKGDLFMSTRENFLTVKKTIMRRPVERKETDVLGQTGIAWAAQATLYGPNYYLDAEQNLVELYDAGAALVFRDLLPKKDKYAREGLYLQLAIAYRTTENANANIRTFSGNHVTLPNSVPGAMYQDPNNYYWVTDDMTLNVNSIYAGEKLWLQRVEWEWVSKEVLYDDELAEKAPYLSRTRDEIAVIYAEKLLTPELVKAYLVRRIEQDEHFAKRCLSLLNADRLLQKDLVALYKDLGVEPGS
jgi:hypothetical protein